LEAMQEGMLWDWVTFPEYMDSLERMPKGVNAVQLTPISPLMIWVMGLDAAKTRLPNDDERREMKRLLHEAMDVGAWGWSIQHLGPSSMQLDYDGTLMPTDLLSDEDILGFAEVLAERKQGFIEITYI